MNHIRIWWMSQQLSYGDACQMWTWYTIGNQCFDSVGNSENNEREEIYLIPPPMMCYTRSIAWRFYVYLYMMTPSNGNIFRITGPVNSPHKGQWCRALMFPLICFWINSWVNNLETGDLRCHRGHYDVIVMTKGTGFTPPCSISSNDIKNTFLIFLS